MKNNDSFTAHTATRANLIIEEALQGNHTFTLAGRKASKLQPLAKKYNLDWIAFDLDDVAKVSEILNPFGIGD